MGAEVAAMLRASPYPNVTVPDYEAAAVAAGWTRNDHNGYFVGPIGSDVRIADYDDWREICETQGIEPAQVPSAEEWAIHDFEGLPSSFGEYCGLQAVADYVALCDEFSHIDSDDMAAIVADFGTVDAAREALGDSFCGVYPAFKDYADSAGEEMLQCHTGLPDVVSRYFDYDAWARDLRHDMHPVDVPSGVAVFHA